MFNQMLEAQRRFQLDLLARSNVVGVAIGYRDFKGEKTDEIALIALVEEKKPVELLDPADLIPREIDGAKTDVFEVGRLVAMENPRDRFRPLIPSGISIGHPQITAGTLGVMVRDRSTGERFILSNNHVLANCNAASIGDPVLQPGPADYGKNPADIVARLERYEPLYFIGEAPPPKPVPPSEPILPPTSPGEPPSSPTPPTAPTLPINPPVPPGTDGRSGCDIVGLIGAFGNLLTRLNSSSQKRLQTASASEVAAAPAKVSAMAQVDIPLNRLDAALARPADPDIFSDNILQIGQITATANPVLGMQVAKMGRTTGYTEGMISQINATVDVSYNTVNGIRTARFTGQMLTSPMSQGGDSGSLIVQQGTTSAVGLLFAGSSRATIFTPISVVMDQLNLTF